MAMLTPSLYLYSHLTAPAWWTLFVLVSCRVLFFAFRVVADRFSRRSIIILVMCARGGITFDLFAAQSVVAHYF